MKLDTSQPKDWSKFIKDLGLTGLCKLLMQHCAVESWNFPNIVLKLEPAQQPFISPERAEELRIIFNAYYECNNISLTIMLAKVEPEKNIVDVVKEAMKLKKSGANYVACCPFHHELTPSFCVNQEKQFYHCFGCGAHGDVKDFTDALAAGEMVALPEEGNEVLYQHEINLALSLLTDLVDSIKDIAFEIKDVRKEIADISNQM